MTGQGRPGRDRVAGLEDRVRRLEAEVRRLEDERAVRAVLARFSFFEDTGRDDEWLALWTVDGVYDMVAVVTGPGGGTREMTQRYTGVDELRALMGDPQGQRRPGFFGHALHTHAATAVVALDGDTAVVHAYTVLHHESEGAVSTASAASNRWTLRRVGGRWLVSGRVRRQLGTAGFAEALGGAGDDPSR